MENNNNNQPKQPKTDLGNPYHDKQGQFSAPKQNNPVNPAPKQNKYKMKENTGNQVADFAAGLWNKSIDNQSKPNNNKPLKQMGLNEKDLEPADQSPMFKAKQAALEAGKKGGYDDYSDFDEKGELMARPARTTSLLGDTSKFHPDAQVRGIKKFNDGHFEYQLKNPEDKDFRDFRYDDKNGHISKELYDFKQNDEARINAQKVPNDYASDRVWPKEDFYKAFKKNGIELSPEEQQEFETLWRNHQIGAKHADDDFDKFYGKEGFYQNTDKSRQEYLNASNKLSDFYERVSKPKENESSNERTIEDIEKELNDMETNKPATPVYDYDENGSENGYNLKFDNPDDQKRYDSLTKEAAKLNYKDLHNKVKENNRKMQLMTSQVPYNGLDAKSKEEYDRLKEQNEEFNENLDNLDKYYGSELADSLYEDDDEYDTEVRENDSNKVLNQMGLDEKDVKKNNNVNEPKPYNEPRKNSNNHDGDYDTRTLSLNKKNEPEVNFKGSFLYETYTPARITGINTGDPEEWNDEYGDYDIDLKELLQELIYEYADVTDEEYDKIQEMYKTKNFDMQFLSNILDKYLDQAFNNYYEQNKKEFVNDRYEWENHIGEYYDPWDDEGDY